MLEQPWRERGLAGREEVGDGVQGTRICPQSPLLSAVLCNRMMKGSPAAPTALNAEAPSRLEAKEARILFQVCNDSPAGSTGPERQRSYDSRVEAALRTLVLRS